MFNQMECQGVEFNNGLCVDLQQKQILLQDLISQETLVFFIDEGYCTSCVKDVIDKIGNDEKLKMNTIIICNNFPLRDMAQRYRSWQTDIKCVSYKSPGENWLPAYEFAQALFILNPELKKQDVFFPVNTGTDLSGKYLQMVSKKYFN